MFIRSFSQPRLVPPRWLAAVLASLLVATVAEGQVAPAAYWRFDEGAGAKAKDSSGEKNHATITGATYTTDAPGLPGGSANPSALLFAADGDYVALPVTGTNLEAFPDGITVEAFVKPAVLPIPADSSGKRLRYIVWADDDIYSLLLVSDDVGDTMLRGIVNSVGGAPGGPCTVQLDVGFENTSTFSHIAMTFGDEVLKLYIDGAEAGQKAAPAGCGSQVGTVAGIANAVHIGSDETAVCCFTLDRNFRGVIDQVRINGSPLDPSEFLISEPITACPAEPIVGCQNPSKGGASQLEVDAGRDKLKWIFKKTAISLPEVGDPRGDTDFYLCLYDEEAGVPSLRSSGALSAGSGWEFKKKKSRFVFKSAEDDGIKKVALRTGSKKKSQIKITAVGSGAPDLPLSQGPRTILQFVNSALQCWEAVFSEPAEANDAARFEDRSD